MKKILLVFSILFLYSCSLRSPHIIQLSQEDRFISNQLLEFDLDVGYNISIENRKKVEEELRIALREIEEQINVRFNIISEKEVILEPETGLLQGPLCAIQLDMEKYASDRHVNLCFVSEPIRQGEEGQAAGVYFHPHGIVLSWTEDNSISSINTLIHELGHFLGSEHTEYGVMHWKKIKIQDKHILKFSQEAINQIRFHQQQPLTPCEKSIILE